MRRNVEKLKTQVLQLRMKGLAHHRTLCWCSIPMFRHKLDLHWVEYTKIHENINSSLRNELGEGLKPFISETALSSLYESIMFYYSQQNAQKTNRFK